MVIMQWRCEHFGGWPMEIGSLNTQLDNLSGYTPWESWTGLYKWSHRWRCTWLVLSRQLHPTPELQIFGLVMLRLRVPESHVRPSAAVSTRSIRRPQPPTCPGAWPPQPIFSGCVSGRPGDFPVSAPFPPLSSSNKSSSDSSPSDDASQPLHVAAMTPKTTLPKTMPRSKRSSASTPTRGNTCGT
jgi:hypothetical protein